MFRTKLSIKYLNKFYPLEVVGGGRETLFQVDENFNSIIWRFKG